VNVGSFIFTVLLLRVIWPPPSSEEIKRNKEIETKINELQQSYLSLEDRRDAPIDVYEGESAGDYSQPWTQTFDLTFLIMMICFFIILSIWTTYVSPQVWHNVDFWLEQVAKTFVMCAVSCFGGALCRYFCDTDELGYIITNKSSAFKVNYTRKLQHFAAYLVPLLLRTKAAASVPGPLSLAWGNWFTMLSFLILIKPIRERFSIVMIQFNSLDRPEDRPNTLNWIIGGNILPGAFMIMFFRWLYSFSGQQDLTYIFVFITGIGDGLAEPVGIYLGKHKYWTKGIGGTRRYQRSLEGSACVWLSSLFFVSVMWYTFASAAQFWVAMVLLPPLMTYAEATSPHTVDTPFLMGVGGITLWVISHVEVLWI
jgi:dolichol kinase